MNIQCALMEILMEIIVNYSTLNPLPLKSETFTLSNSRQFHSSKGASLGVSGLNIIKFLVFLFLFYYYLYNVFQSSSPKTKTQILRNFACPSVTNT